MIEGGVVHLNISGEMRSDEAIIALQTEVDRFVNELHDTLRVRFGNSPHIGKLNPGRTRIIPEIITAEEVRADGMLKKFQVTIRENLAFSEGYEDIECIRRTCRMFEQEVTETLSGESTLLLKIICSQIEETIDRVSCVWENVEVRDKFITWIKMFDVPGMRGV